MKNVKLEIESLETRVVKVPDEPYSVKTSFDIWIDETSPYNSCRFFAHVISGNKEANPTEIITTTTKGKLILKKDFILGRRTTVSALKWEIWDLIKEMEELNIPLWLKEKALQDFDFLQVYQESDEDMEFRIKLFDERKTK